MNNHIQYINGRTNVFMTLIKLLKFNSKIHPEKTSHKRIFMLKTRT